MPISLTQNIFGPKKTKTIFILVFLIAFLNNFFVTAQSYSKLVDTQIGSEGSGLGCGFNFVGAAYPFGMIQFTPSFFSPQKGFVVNQLSGAGCPHMGNFPVLPISGVLQDSPNNMENFDKYTSIIESHAGFVSLELNGREIKTPWIDWNVIKNGGSLNFKTSKKNYKNWGLNTVSPSYQKLKSITN